MGPLVHGHVAEVHQAAFAGAIEDLGVPTILACMVLEIVPRLGPDEGGQRDLIAQFLAGTDRDRDGEGSGVAGGIDGGLDLAAPVAGQLLLERGSRLGRRGPDILRHAVAKGGP